MSVNEKMTSIANEVRTLANITDALGLDAIASNLHNANEDLQEQDSLILQISQALEGKVLPSGNTVTATLFFPYGTSATINYSENGEVKAYNHSFVADVNGETVTVTLPKGLCYVYNNIVTIQSGGLQQAMANGKLQIFNISDDFSARIEN